eukprot:gnl/MRDRNA2_/MRDRNA2_89271_c0_seq1.p1 gnl/MRDRNA2_/MRDRNA2_89271_c0~~gnl/MRDRNA2_/MRDRNA2_89271_c0_seq1.p1  ORF type:complete len:185 (-),score=46.03 gnl/MRDRNA2_/MRDRNA2_89271_c0_seq1:319-873(-)
MLSVVAISLLAVVAHAEEKTSDPLTDLMSMANSDEFMDKVADKLITKLADTNILGATTQDDPNILMREMIQSELDRAADRGTAYEWIKYNSEVDQRMALEAEAAVALMNQRAGRVANDNSDYNAPNASPAEEELVQASTDNLSLPAVALMACFACSVLFFSVRHFQNRAPKEAFVLAGYTPLNA